MYHTVLLNTNNNVITFGENWSSQCTSLMNDNNIFLPHIVSKEKEIGINSNHFIEKILAGTNNTIVIVNMHKKIKK